MNKILALLRMGKKVKTKVEEGDTMKKMLIILCMGMSFVMTAGASEAVAARADIGFKPLTVSIKTPVEAGEVKRKTMAAVRVLLELDMDPVALRSDEEIMHQLCSLDELKESASVLCLSTHEALRVVPFCIEYLECRERGEDVCSLFSSDEARKEKWVFWSEKCRKLSFSRDQGGLLCVLIEVGEVIENLTMTYRGNKVMRPFINAMHDCEWGVRADGKAFIAAMGEHGTMVPDLLESSSGASIEDRAPYIYDTIRCFDAIQDIFFHCLNSVCDDLALHVPREYYEAYVAYEKQWVGTIKAFGLWLKSLEISPEDSATLCYELPCKCGNLASLLAFTAGDKQWINDAAEDFVGRTSGFLQRELRQARAELSEYRSSSDKVACARRHCSMTHAEKVLRILARQGVVRSLIAEGFFSSALARNEFKKMVGLL